MTIPELDLKFVVAATLMHTRTCLARALSAEASAAEGMLVIREDLARRGASPLLLEELDAYIQSFATEQY